jgi:hypothetical protein
VPFAEVRIDDEFLNRQGHLMQVVAMSLAEGLHRIEGVVDSDAFAALDGLAQTYKTRQSGLLYDSKPNNTVAAALFELIQLRITEFSNKKAEQSGFPVVLDSHIFGVLLFYLRLARQLRQQRRYSRSFFDAVLGFLAHAGYSAPSNPPRQNLVI